MEAEDRRPASGGLFEHPDVKSLLGNVMTSLVGESDRGAVLVAAVYVDECLKDLLSSVAPRGYARKGRRLGTLSTRADIAFVGRLISEPMYSAIQALRKLRNSVAHEAREFKLENHESEIRGVFEIGPDVPGSVQRMAIEAMMATKMPDMMAVRDPSDETQPYFKNPQELLDYISDKPDIISSLERQLPRYKLAVGIWFIVAMLVWARDASCALYGDSGTAASVEARLRRLQEGQAECGGA